MSEPTPATSTIRGPGPGPVREGALARMLAMVGEREQGGKNWGPVVQKVAGPFLSPNRLETYAPGGSRAGKLQWCALTASYVYLAELEARGQQELASQWKRIASASCSTLYGNLDLLGWAWKKGNPLPSGILPLGGPSCGLPAPGDLVFYGDDFHHVDLFKLETPAGFDSVGGNSGPACDEVALCERLDEKVPPLRYARIPW